MKTRLRIIAAAVILLTMGLIIFLQQTGIVSADDITVTIAGPAGPTNVSPIPLTITFNADVTEFELADIDVVNGTAGNLAGEDDTYTVDITPDVEEGLVTVDIGANVVAEGNAAAETYSIYFDSVAPTVTITSTSTDPTGNSLIPITLTFSEAITGLTITEISDALQNGEITYYVAGSDVVSMVVQASGFGEVELTLPADIYVDLAGNLNGASETFSLPILTNPG